MKTVSEKIIHGKRRLTIELDEGEEILTVRTQSHYKLGYPVEDVIAAHVLTEMVEVAWCSAQQEWVQ